MSTFPSTKHTVARHVPTNIEVGTEPWHRRFAGLRHRKQGTGFGIPVAEAEEIGGMSPGQDDEVALHVSGQNARGVAVPSPVPNGTPSTRWR